MSESDQNHDYDKEEEDDEDTTFNELLRNEDHRFTNDSDGFEFVVGAVARKFRTEFPYVVDLTSKSNEEFVRLTAFSLLDHDYAYPNSYVDHLSQGGLVKPSAVFLDQAEQFEKAF